MQTQIEVIYYYIDGMQELVNSYVKKHAQHVKSKEDYLAQKMFQQYIEGMQLMINGVRDLLDRIEP